MLRAGVLYAGAAWALAQGIAQLGPLFHAPEWAMRGFVIACVIAFPFWLGFAWFYEFTPQGIQRESEVTDDASDRHSIARKLDFAIIGVLIVAVVLLASGYFIRRAAPTSAAQPAPAKSIAVLPFQNLSADKDNEYFVAGMQDLILTKLADIGDLKVISRTSTAKFASRPDNLKTIGEQLGVANILEGSVQKTGNQVLINVQLIDVHSNGHVWAQSYQRTLDNIFGVEGEVAEKVAAALKAKLTPIETTRVASVPTTNAVAYNAFLQGKYYENHGFIPNNDKIAADYYRKAVAQDPHFALAWARLSTVLSDGAQNHGSNAAQAQSALNHAVALAPDSLAVHMAQGWYLDYVKKDLDGAMATFGAVAKLQPNNAQALFAVGVMHGHKGQWKDALGFLQKAVALAPQDTALMQELVVANNALRRYSVAVPIARRIVAIDPNDGAGWVRLAKTYEFMGDPGSALAAYNEMPPNIGANPYLSFDRAHTELMVRNYVAARKLLAAVKPVAGMPRAIIEFARGDVEQFAGDTARARKHYLSAKALMEADFKLQPDARGFAAIVMLTAKLGQRKEALAQASLAMREHAASKPSNPFADECEEQYAMAQFQAVLGNTAAAVKALDWLLARAAGNYLSVPLLKIDPTWDSIRKDARFQALLKKYGDTLPRSPGNTYSSATASVRARPVAASRMGGAQRYPSLSKFKMKMIVTSTPHRI